MGWLMQRTGTSGKTTYTAMYRDIRGRKRSAGTFSSRREAERAWQRAQTHQEIGRVRELKQGRQSLRHYIETTWLPNHVMELSTRERYTYLITKWILPELGDLPIADLMPSDVREWVRRLGEVHDLNPPTIKYAKNVLDAVLTTALNDQLTFLHAGRGVKTPPVATRPPTVLSVEQFEALYRAVEDPTMRLMIETAIESGLRWGELTELRAGDLNTATGVLTVTRSVLHLKAATWQGPRFVVKDYPKDKQWRRLRLAGHLVTKLTTHIAEHHLVPGDLVFFMPDHHEPRRRCSARRTAGPCDARPDRTQPARPPLPSRHPNRLRRRRLPLPTLPRLCRCLPCLAPLRREGPPEDPAYCADRWAHRQRLVPRPHPPSQPPAPPDSPTPPPPTAYATPTPPGSSPAAPTSKSSKNASATPASPPPSATSTPCPAPTTPPSPPSTTSAAHLPEAHRPPRHCSRA